MRCYSLVSVNKQCHDILQSCLRQQVAQGDITVLTVSVNTVVRHHRHHSLVCVNIFYRATSTVRHSKKSCLRQEVVIIILAARKAEKKKIYWLSSCLLSCLSSFLLVCLFVCLVYHSVCLSACLAAYLAAVCLPA